MRWDCSCLKAQATTAYCTSLCRNYLTRFRLFLFLREILNCELWIHWWAGIICSPFISSGHVLSCAGFLPDYVLLYRWVADSSFIFISPVAVKEEHYSLQFVSFESSRFNTAFRFVVYKSVMSGFMSCHYLSLLVSISGVLDCQFHPTQPWIFTAGADHLIRLYTW